MELVREFSLLDKGDAAIAGGKGASLGEMTQAGIPVPPGFVILAAVFERFLEETDLLQEIDAILHTVNKGEIHTVEHASEKIQSLILAAQMREDIRSSILQNYKVLGAEFVAVRSSATAEDSASAAWAGQLDSFLNITEADLLKNVQKCWASLFTPRAIFYRFEKELHQTKISVAVVVQKMVQSESAGIAFSVHPVTEDRNQLIIEAGFGLGDRIVSGEITPDSYVVEKEPRRILDLNIQQSSQVLNNEEINELSDLVIKIEHHYGFPCDIEWAFADGKFYIVQSRPITTLTNKIKSVQRFKREDYLLVFWVQGVSVFVTDIHLDVYRELEVLYIIDCGMFNQYFTKRAYERALDRGLAFYSDNHSFDEYQKALTSHCDKFKEFFETGIKNKETLSRETVTAFFSYTRKLCGDYGKMNIEFTDKAFAHQEENPVVKKNLSGVAAFKDRIRATMNTVLFEPDGYSVQFFNILGRQFDLPSSLLDNLTQDEILDLFEGKKPSELIVLKRQEAFVESYNLDGFYEGKEAQAVIESFKEDIPNTDNVQGQVASPGKAIGKVKVISVDYGNLARVNAEIEKMSQGDILVAETTAPELIVACKKAGAIITDMGGLMSHAAIVSREFGIPCIVGTKNASKILKDDDLVEVDANKGVVRIIGR